MFIYPGNDSRWKFLHDGSPQIPPDAILRFVLQDPIDPNMLQKPEPTLNIQCETVSIRLNESDINSVFRNMYGIEYSRLIEQSDPGKSAKSNNFFTIFTPGTEDEEDLMLAFLEENGADIYRYQEEGAWDYFSKNVDYGVVLVSQSRCVSICDPLISASVAWRLRLASPDPKVCACVEEKYQRLDCKPQQPLGGL